MAEQFRLQKKVNKLGENIGWTNGVKIIGGWFSEEKMCGKSVQCTEYNAHCTLYTVHCTEYSVEFTVYSVQCTVYSILYTLYYVRCTDR